MRTTHTLTAAALLLGLGLAAVPAGAQATVTPAEPAMTPAAISAAPAVDQPLLIPAPAGATVQVEMDLRDDDLLGVFKSLLRGVGQGANSVPMPQKVGAANGQDWSKVMAGVLSNADLSDVLKDVTHVHFVLYSLPGGGGTDLMPATPSAKSKPTPPPVSPSMPDQTPFYETAFTAEGGHRIIYVNTDPVHVLMTSFGHARGSAMMVQAPGMLAVMRADGYPDLSKLTALATSLAAAAVPVALNNMNVKTTPPVQTHLAPTHR